MSGDLLRSPSAGPGQWGSPAGWGWGQTAQVCTQSDVPKSLSEHNRALGSTWGHSPGDTRAAVTAHTRLRPPEEPDWSSLSQPTQGD